MFLLNRVPVLRRRRGPEESGVGAQQRLVHLDGLVVGGRVGHEDGAAHRHLLQPGSSLVRPHGRGGTHLLLLLGPDSIGEKDLTQVTFVKVQGISSRSCTYVRLAFCCSIICPVVLGLMPDGKLAELAK